MLPNSCLANCPVLTGATTDLRDTPIRLHAGSYVPYLPLRAVDGKRESHGCKDYWGVQW
jgi:hypothetical protein